MKTFCEMIGEQWRFNVVLDDADKKLIARRKSKLTRLHFDILMPKDFDRSKLHPDVEATIAFIVFGFWCAERFEFERPISQAFSKSSKLELGPIDPNLKPRKIENGGVHGLAFSGGVDSCAALWLMPKESTVSVFLNCTDPSLLYRADAALHSCEKLQNEGFNVHVVDTTMEGVRSPKGFPVDWSIYIGLLALSYKYNFISSNCGMVFESAYRVGSSYFSDLKSRGVYSEWATFFEAIDMPISLPTSGLSEVLTSKLVLENCPLWGAESCVRGKVGQACGACVKCFRKTLLSSKLTSKKPTSEFMKLSKNSTISKFLSQTPIKHENVLAYSILDNAPEDSSVEYDSLLEQVQPRAKLSRNYDFLKCVYQPSFEYIHPSLHTHIKSKLQLVAPFMSEGDIEFLKTWDVRKVTT